MNAIDLEKLFQQGLALQQQGEPAAALRIYNRCLSLAPENPGVLYFIGAAQLQLGQADAALHSFDAALRVSPDHVESLLQRGLLHYAAGRFSQGIADLRTMVGLAPQDQRGWVNLAAAALMDRQFALADEAASRAVQLAPQQADGWNNLGQVRQKTGNFVQAEAAYRRALHLSPQHAGIWLNLADALRAQGRLVEAESAYLSALHLDSRLANTWTNYGNLLLQLRRVPEARSAFERALEASPDAPEPMANLCGLLISVGEERTAIGRLRPLVESGQADADQLAVYVMALRAVGQSEEAERVLRATFLGSGGAEASNGSRVQWPRPGREGGALYDPGHAPKSMVQALGELALARTTLLPQAIAAAESWLDVNEKKAPAAERTVIWNLLARLHDKSAQPARAFAAAAHGKMLEGERSDPAQEMALALALEQTFTRSRLSRAPYGIEDESRPVFIVGMPRSGTSLLEQMLAGHPDVHAAGELDELGYMTHELSPGDPLRWPERAAALDATSLRLLAQRYVHLWPAEIGHARRVTDKMPHNFVRLGLVHLLFPQARVIHIERDPRDVAVSIFLHHFDGHHPYANDIEDIAHHLLFHRRCMAHWRVALPPGVMLEVRYEDLVADPQAHARRIAEFLGLPWHDGLLTPEQARRTVLTSSRFQVQEPIHRRAVSRWRAYAREIAPLSRLLGLPESAGD